MQLLKLKNKNELIIRILILFSTMGCGIKGPPVASSSPETVQKQKFQTENSKPNSSDSSSAQKK